jgi:hypothetical protein
VSDERDTLVEEVRAGDQIRYLGEWYDVVKVRLGIGRFPNLNASPIDPKPSDGVIRAPYVVLTIDDEGVDGSPRTLYFRRGWFVAAECNPRAEAS